MVEEGEDYWTNTEPISESQRSQHRKRVAEMVELDTSSYRDCWYNWVKH